MGDRAQIIVYGDHELNFYTNASDMVRIGTDFSAYGSLVAPNGSIHVYSRTNSLRVAGKYVYIEPNVIFNYTEK